MFSYETKNKEHFKTVTGITVERFKQLFDLVDPGTNCSNLKYYDPSKRKSVVSLPEKKSDTKKTGPKPKLHAIDQLMMTVVWLKNGFSLSHIAWLFNLPKSTVSRHLISWINFLYFTLGSIPIWPTKQQIQETMPESFKNTYPNTRCIIDCTEIFCQSPSSLIAQSALYSHYKSHVTYKALLGIAPSGAVFY